MDKYKKNGATPGVKMVANCAAGNHDCTYTVSGAKGTVYVWEHQTQGGGGRDHRGPGDNTSGGDFKNKFPDEITGQVDSYRFFTISTSQNYDSAKQILVPIQENGEMRGYEHMFNNDYGTGPLYISGHTQLTP